MSKSSLDYWREREQEANKNAIKDEAAYNKRIEEIYSYTERNIQRTINDFYARYAMNNGITMNEARKRVREIDMRHYEQLARKYVREHDFSEQANEEMALYNLTMKVNRLELLKAEINLELLAGYDDIEHEMQKDLLEQAMKVNARYAGILGKSAIGNQKYAHQLVNASFRGATFSERLWGRNMPDLRAHLEVELRNGLIQGIHPRELARRFRKHYGGSVKDTERLMITEMRRLQTSVQKESFERNGFKEYLFITAGDERVCPECAKLHGQHFKVSEMQVGENAPPMHPRCHCSTTAYMDSDKYKLWINALANGEDVRWDEFEVKKIFPLSSSLSTNDVGRSASELEAVAHGIKKDMKKYIEKPSKWSGTVRTVSDISKMPIKDAAGYKDWNCDIVVLSNVTDYILWHEMIHSSSVSYYDETVYLENQIIEEYSVELLTREICKEKRIETSNYDDKRMECLLIVGEYLGYRSRLQFAKDLFNHDLPDRYDWLEAQFYDKMLSDGLDVIEMQEGIDYIRKLQGGLENGHKNSPIT